MRFRIHSRVLCRTESMGCASSVPHDRPTVFQMVYASALAATEERAAEDILSAIIASSLRNNPALDITGMLYYDRVSMGVVQVLEGPEQSVRDLYAKILGDPRHKGCELLSEHMVVQRTHADFGMALARCSAGDTDELKRAAADAGVRTSGLPHAYARARKAGREGMHLVRMQYNSTLVAAGPEEARLLLRDILAKSVANNSDLSIGGLLCFNPTTLGVVQVLEGPAFAVLSTYSKIKADRRHTAVVLTCEEVLPSKAECHFDASWGMMQSETRESQLGLLDLSTRLARAAAAHSSHASTSAIQASVSQIRDLEAAQRQELVDGVVQEMRVPRVV